ncbi:MAG: right-handed parallel beta-helix repeat-containing protein [Rhodocyclaceae bacterium]
MTRPVARLLLALCATSFLAACGGDDDGDNGGDNSSSTSSSTSSASSSTSSSASSSLTSIDGITLATGHALAALPEAKAPFFNIADYGAVSGGAALTNQKAIDDAITAAANAGGGTVIVPAGDFKTYTIHLKSNVNLHLQAANSILRAAVQGTGAGQDGGFYDAPELNLFVGLQDHGHSHWANSLIYGVDVRNVTISGPGLIDGSYIDGSGATVNVLSGNDPSEVTTRTATGTAGGANKAIALKNVDNVVMRDFRIKNGGHFAIIGTGVIGWTMDNLIIDTNRDALDVDASQDVTIRNSVFNSLTDDAIVLKASFGLGRYLPTRNVLIENCTVSGYDAGSVLDGAYSTQKLVATDRDGPTARIKLGTEGTTGFERVTVRNVTFDRSRGFALESVDGAELVDIVLTDATMKNVSSSPIFIRLGDRGRAPITGNSASEATSPTDTVRLDDRGWVLPNLTAKYGNWPAVRYIPSYDKTADAPIGGASTPFKIVSPTAPTKLNPNSVQPNDPLYANAVGVGFARVRNISISNVKITDVDPRYPILIAGLVDHPIENVKIRNVSVEYRGGLGLQHAVEQRQLNQTWSYTGYQAAAATQSLPWLANTFFSKNEALLPRISWNASANGGAGAWQDDPYNIPEMPREYPEPSLFGILPAYGLYARHVTGLTVSDVSFTLKTSDTRAPVVLDDVADASFTGFTAPTATGVPSFVRVTHTKKREADREYVPNQPYKTTTVSNVSLPAGAQVADVTVDRPAPGTPADTLYSAPTAPSATAPYSYAVADASYPFPLTVHRPHFDSLGKPSVAEGQALQFTVNAKSPGGSALSYSVSGLPGGASFDAGTRSFNWTPASGQAGSYTVRFVVDDGVIPEAKDVTITVTR